MVEQTLADALREEIGGFPPGLDRETIDRVFTEPEQDTLAEAIAADAVDAAPFVGDLLAIQRLEKADEQGIDYPDTPVFVQDTAADLPTPLDLLSDALLLYHSPHYLEQEYGIEVRNPPQERVESLARRVDSLIEP